MNRHTKYEDVMKKIDTVGEGIEFSCLTCGEHTNQEKCYFMTRTDEQEYGKILVLETLNLDFTLYISPLINQYQFELL
jgi:hypothetical protein